MTGSAHASAALFGCNDYAYMLMHGAEHCILRMAECGFREFELMVHPGHLWPAEFGAAQRRALHGLFERDALELTTLNLPNIDINLASTTPEMRAYTLDLLEAIVRLAGELGARGVVLSPGKASPLLPPAPETLRGHFFAALDRLAPIAKAAGTALWIENVTVSFLPGIAVIMDTLAAYGDDDIRIVYDVANAHFIGEDFVQGLKTCRERLELVHLSDTTRKLYRHDPVGAGDVPFSAVPAALAAVGYRARCMLEIISTEPDRDIPESAARLAAMGFAAPA